MSDDPWKPLRTIAAINMVLGTAAAVRVVGELVQLLSSVRIGGDPWYLVILILDVPIALLWVAAGSELRIPRAINLVPTVVAAGIALGDSLAGATFLGPVLADFLITERVGLRTGAFGSRLLLYVVQL